MNHPNVVESPITNETLLIHNLVTGQKERVSKLLLQISIRELHNDMLLLQPDEGGFKEARDETGNVRISFVGNTGTVGVEFTDSLNQAHRWRLTMSLASD